MQYTYGSTFENNDLSGKTEGGKVDTNIDKGDITINEFMLFNTSALEKYFIDHVETPDTVRALNNIDNIKVDSDDYFEGLGDALEGVGTLVNLESKMRRKMLENEDLRHSVSEVRKKLKAFLNTKSYRTTINVNVEDKEPGLEGTLNKVIVTIETTDPDELIEVKRRVRNIARKVEDKEDFYTHVRINSD